MGSSEKKLFLIPCCSTKNRGGNSPPPAAEPLRTLISSDVYFDILKARKQVLSGIRQNDEHMSTCKNKKNKLNRSLKLGPDFGGKCTSGLYLPAAERYAGTLYSNAPSLSSWNGPDILILILSGLYGPLHPMSHIQDYNLQMSDGPAYGVWKTLFPRFLRDYVSSNGIREIHLFFGSSTRYLKVAKAAVKSLSKEELVRAAVQYHVTDGNQNQRQTPKTHGKMLENCLERGIVDELPGNVEARAL